MDDEISGWPSFGKPLTELADVGAKDMPKQWITRAALAILLFIVAASSTRIALAEDVLVAEYSGNGIQI
jgi:hypothetical protein